LKATGIVRRIDDLGRVVIPKEIRRTMRIREGDPLEIYTDKDGEVIFKKYSPMGELSAFATQICETLNKTSGFMAAVSDRDVIIAVSGAAKRDLMDKRLSEGLEHIMESRQVYQYKQSDAQVNIVDGQDKYRVGIAAPIIAEGDVTGCVLFVIAEGAAVLGDTEYKLAQTVAGFLGKQMES
jgi:AbrB family transcriptional regulator (stage V sporulation protein T)